MQKQNETATVFVERRLSIVVPVYMGKPFLDELCLRVVSAVSTFCEDFELILVNDASPDQCWDDIVRLCGRDRRIKGVNLSRNFGQHYAITAGLAHVTGEWCVVMDCDLQDRPEEIPGLFAKAGEGYDSVIAQRKNRKDTWCKCFQSRMFYAVFSYLTDTKMDASVANFGIYHFNVIQAILSMGDKLRYFPVMVQWVGFRKAFCPVQHDERKEGDSSYSFVKLIILAMDTILSFSEKLLNISVRAGISVTILAFLSAFTYFVLAVMGRLRVSGFASLIISIWFLIGIMMTMFGILSFYLGKVFNQVKNRPVFIVAAAINLEGPSDLSHADRS